MKNKMGKGLFKIYYNTIDNKDPNKNDSPKIF